MIRFEDDSVYEAVANDVFAKSRGLQPIPVSSSVIRSSAQAILSSGGYRLHAKAEYVDEFSVALGGATDGATQRMAMENFLSKYLDELFRFWVSRAGSSEKELDLGEGDLKYFTNRVWPVVTAYFDKSRVEEI